MNREEKRYSIRKLKLGVCSVVIASMFFGVLPILGNNLINPVVVNAQDANVDIKEAQVEINIDTVVARVSATSNVQFTLKFGNETHVLNETPSSEQGVSTYEVTVPRTSIYELPPISISYVENNQEQTVTYDDYVGLRDALSKVTKKPISVSGNAPSDEDIARLVDQLKEMYTTAGYPIENPDSNIVVDKNAGVIAITTKFPTDNVWNLKKEYTGLYKINSFVVYTKESTIKNNAVKLSNFRIGGSFVAPRGGTAKLVYGSAEIPMRFFFGKYNAVDVKVDSMISDNIVKMILTNADGTVEEKIINVQDGDFSFVPYHVQADRFVKEKGSIVKLQREDNSVPLTEEDRGLLVRAVEAAVQNAPFKDKVTQVYSLGSNIIVKFENMTLSDGTVVSYEYFIPETNLIEYPNSVTEVPFETIYVADETLDQGVQQVETEGVAGEDTTTITYLTNPDGSDAGSETNTVRSREVVNKIVKVGTKPTVTVEEVPFNTTFVEDKSLDYPLGDIEVEGVNGTVTTTITYTVDPTTGAVSANAPVVERVDAIDEVIKVGTKPTVTTQEVAFETVYVADETLDQGVQQVETEGVAGEDTTTVTYEFDSTTGEITESSPVTVRSREVVNKVVKVGTKPTVIVEEVPFETEFVEDKTIEYPLGEFEVEGVDGTITTTTTYTVDPTTGEVIANEPTVESVAAITEVIRVGTKPVVTKEEVPFETEYVADDTLENGIQQVEVEGVAGEDTITTTFTFDATTAEVTMNEPVTERTREVVNKVVKVGTKPTVTVEEVPFEIEYVNDETLENGVQQVEVEGENGEDTTTITYTLNSQTGELTASDPVQIRTKEAVKKVVKVGTKEKAIIKPIDKDSKNSENKQSNKEESQTLPKTGDNNSNVFSLGLVLISASLYVASKKRNK